MWKNLMLWYPVKLAWPKDSEESGSWGNWIYTKLLLRKHVQICPLVLLESSKGIHQNCSVGSGHYHYTKFNLTKKWAAIRVVLYGDACIIFFFFFWSMSQKLLVGSWFKSLRTEPGVTSNMLSQKQAWRSMPQTETPCSTSTQNMHQPN